MVPVTGSNIMAMLQTILTRQDSIERNIQGLSTGQKSVAKALADQAQVQRAVVPEKTAMQIAEEAYVCDLILLCV